MTRNTRIEVSRWVGVVSISAVFSWLAVHRANILGREQLKDAVADSVRQNESNRAKHFDDLAERLRGIEDRIERPSRQNVAADWRSP